MSHELLHKQFIVNVLPTPTGAAGGPVDFNATGDKFIVTKPVPFDVYRWGFITIEAMDPDAGGFVISLEKRPTVGSDTDRTVIDTITRADADTVAAGKVVYKDTILAVAEASGDDTLAGGTTPQTSLVNVGPSGPAHFAPGDEAVIEVTNAVGAASTGYVWLEIVEYDFALPSTASGVDGSDVIEDLS